MSDIDRLEDAIYSLERAMEKNFHQLADIQKETLHVLHVLTESIVELQKLHNIDNERPPDHAPDMVKQTFEKHQFAKRLAIGEKYDRSA